MRHAATPLALTLSAALVAPAAAQLVRNTVDLPGSQTAGGDAEGLAFADIDRDGDLDVVLARNGGGGGAQNLLWVNQGGLQGGSEGRFVDETATRLPAVTDPSRGVEFVDIDGDGDPDLFVANLTATGPSRWWVNQGGLQGGALGHFADETTSRWLGLGGPGSSFAPTDLLGAGSFRSFAADAAFADFDDDGDLDLALGVNAELTLGVPTRLFLNDGQGRFTEHNPSGYQLSGSALPTGAPGLWCDGVQQPDTLDTTGAQCDLDCETTDLDVADVDGDFDLDLLVGHLSGLPRLYANRTRGSTLAPATSGLLTLRDVTHLAFPTPHATGALHYAQEFGDLDGDGDVDLYGVNWGATLSSYADVTLTNLGAGVFGPRVAVVGSSDDDDDCALFDYDSDGDVDTIVANFAKGLARDTLFRNDTTAVDDLRLTDRSVDLADTTTISSGVRGADVDGDGDTDAFMTGAGSSAQVYFENVFDVPDTRAPRVPRLEDAPHRVAGPTPTVVHAHVFDGAPTPLAGELDVRLRYRVDGGARNDVAMRWSGAQVFRAELPGALTGLVEYEVLAADLAGNVGSSAAQSFLVTSAGQVGATFCAPNSNSTGAAARIGATGSNVVAANDLVLRVTGLPQGSAGYFLVSLARGLTPNPAGSQGVLCLGGLIGRFVGPGQVLSSGLTGAVQLPVDLTRLPTPSGPVAVVPGDLWHFTYWYRDQDPAATTNLSDGLSVAFE